MRRAALLLFIICGYSYASEQPSSNSYIPRSFSDQAVVLVLQPEKDIISLDYIAYLKRRYPNTTSLVINNLRGNQHLDYFLACALITAFPRLREIQILNSEVRWSRTIELLHKWQQADSQRKLEFTYTLLPETVFNTGEFAGFFDKFK